MLSPKERDERGRSIRAHLLVYMKTGRRDELDRADAEMENLVDLEERAPAVDQ